MNSIFRIWIVLILGFTTAFSCKCDDISRNPFCGEKCMLKKKTRDYENVVLVKLISPILGDSIKKIWSGNYIVLKKWKGNPKDTLRFISNGNSSCTAFHRDTLIVMFNENEGQAYTSSTTFANNYVTKEDFDGIQLHMCSTIPVFGQFLFNPKRFSKTIFHLDKIFKSTKQN